MSNMENIQWKQSDIDYDSLFKISHKDIVSASTLRKYRRPDLGGTKQKDNCNLVKWQKENRELFLNKTSEANKLRKTFGTPEKTKIECYKYDTNELVGIFESISECARQLVLDKGNISKVIKGKLKQTNGYIFKKIN
jgi:hypothetical protein